MRTILALVIGGVLAVVMGLVLGEYPFVGFTPYLIAALVPAIMAATVVGVGQRHLVWLWAASGVLSAACIGWALWISTGQGLDPVPGGGWAAIALALAWPVARAGYLAQRTRQSSTGGDGIRTGAHRPRSRRVGPGTRHSVR